MFPRLSDLLHSWANLASKRFAVEAGMFSLNAFFRSFPVGEQRDHG